jgi:hypothetical protein
MPAGRYFLGLTGAVLLGLAVLALSIVIFILALPYILPFFMTILPGLVLVAVAIVAIIVIWIILYVAAVIGIAIIYFFRHPVRVSKVDKGYSIEESKESGRREKGESKK